MFWKLDISREAVRDSIILILCLNISDITVAEGKDIQTIQKEIENSRKQLYDVDKQIKEKKKATRKAAEEEKKVIKKLEVKEKPGQQETGI